MLTFLFSERNFSYAHLQMKRAWMLGTSDQQQQQYRLAAAVLHHGQGLGRGHYTAVCRVNLQHWIHWDDSSHRLITETEALNMCAPPPARF
jgi:ubiquitin C-terminal hydrolase